MLYQINKFLLCTNFITGGDAIKTCGLVTIKGLLSIFPFTPRYMMGDESCGHFNCLLPNYDEAKWEGWFWYSM